MDAAFSHAEQTLHCTENLKMTIWRVAACQAPLCVGFPRQEYWSGLPFSSPGDLPTYRSNSHLLHWQADSLPLGHQGNPSK